MRAVGRSVRDVVIAVAIARGTAQFASGARGRRGHDAFRAKGRAAARRVAWVRLLVAAQFTGGPSRGPRVFAVAAPRRGVYACESQVKIHAPTSTEESFYQIFVVCYIYDLLRYEVRRKPSLWLTAVF